MGKNVVTSIIFFVISVGAAACSSDDDPPAQGGTAGTGTGGTNSGGSAGAGGDAGSGGEGMPGPVEPSAETKAIWESISGYQDWPKFPELQELTQSASHMNMLVMGYHNDIVADAITNNTLPLPDGALIVKDNFANATDPTPMAVTVMAKQAGEWYWIQATPDGKVMVDTMVEKGKPLEGKDVQMCVGCHSGFKDNDYVGIHQFK